MLFSSNCISCVSPALDNVTVSCFLSKFTRLELSLSLHPRKIPNSIIQKSLEELTSWVLLGWSVWTLPLALCSSHRDAAANPAELNNPTLILLGTTPPWGAISDCFSCSSQDSSDQAMTSYRTPLKDNPLSNRNAHLRTHGPKPRLWLRHQQSSAKGERGGSGFRLNSLTRIIDAINHCL